MDQIALVPLALLTAGSAWGFLWAYNSFSQVMIDVGSQQSPQLIYFGTDARVKDPSKWVVPIEVLAGYFFVLVALLFVGPGQEMGRRFAAIDNRRRGLLRPISSAAWRASRSSALMSYFRVPAWAWFLIALAIAVRLRPAPAADPRTGAAWRCSVWSPWPTGRDDALGAPTEVIWSPYYQVRFKPRYLSIDVNNIGHQGMLPVDRAGPAYFLPHLLNRDAGNKPFDDVLIIGAGSGNDVAAALAQRAGHVDAVEIDPVINELGRLHHPNQPYSDPRVTIHLDDGRSFVRKTTRHYDLISYALVDSLALHSSYSSVRLESFLFTEQAFRDVKAKLKPGGVFAMYNFYRQGWVVGRLVKLAENGLRLEAARLLVAVSRRHLPRQQPGRSPSRSSWPATATSPVVESIRSQFAAERFFWLNLQPASQRGDQRLWPDASGERTATCRAGPRQDRPGRGRAERNRPGSRPTTGRSSTSASRRSPRSTCAAWRSWRCSRW